MPAGAAAVQHVTHIGADLLFRGVGAVDGRAHAAHEDHAAIQLPLQGGDVIFRQHPLPALDAQLHHVFHNGDQVGVGVVDGDAALFTDRAVKAAIGFLIKFTPHLRIHEQGLFCPPVVVGKDGVGFQAVNEHVDVIDAVFRDVLDKFYQKSSIPKDSVYFYANTHVIKLERTVESYMSEINKREKKLIVLVNMIYQEKENVIQESKEINL